jgi:Mn-dependent DtxR family transcriptional regulator
MSKSIRTKTSRSRQPAGKAHAAPSISTEDYLERIAELTERKGFARAVDIASVLEVSQPSVTAMVQRLAREGYLHYEKYRGLLLTDKGRAVALQIKSRHTTLKRFLSVIGVDEQTQENDIEGWEHCLSASTVDRLGKLADFLSEHADLREHFARCCTPPPAG